MDRGWIALGMALQLNAARAQEPVAPALAAAPAIVIGNGIVTARLLRPDRPDGFYRGTRFDWSGLVASLRIGALDYYGPWFDLLDPAQRDYAFTPAGIAAGLQSRAMGPADTFDPDAPPGWDAAPPGGTFVKIGVGVLRKPADGKPYSQFDPYELVDGGTWTVRAARDRVTFAQRVRDPVSGIAYRYTKTIVLAPGTATMEIRHRLRNLGRQPLDTVLYNHNFLPLAGREGNAGVTIAMPFAPVAVQPPRSDALVFSGRDIRYRRALADRETASADIAGFGTTPHDYDFTVRAANGAGYRVVGDRPVHRIALWSIRSNVSLEPYVALHVAPGATERWSYRYTYFPAGAGR